MGLRDRLQANYYLPLVAGTDAAQRGGLLAPAEIYAPGLIDGGSGSPGGIGMGDGGNDTPSDPTVTKPSITYPNSSANTDIDVDANSTSSAFASTNGQTHARSRWVIEFRGAEDDDEDIASFVVYDSGPTSSSLTSLNLEPANLGRSTRYAIKVRHKGSNGGWSEWSDYQPFDTEECDPDIGDPILWWDFTDNATLTLTGSAVDAVTDKGTGGHDLTALSSGQKGNISTSVFAGGAVSMAGNQGYLMDAALTPVGGVLHVFIVFNWAAVANYQAMALFSNNNAGVLNSDWLGVASSPAGAGFLVAYDRDLGPTLASTANSVASGKHLAEYKIDSAGTTRIYLDGVEVASSIGAYDNFAPNQVNGQTGVYVGPPGGEGQWAEVLAYGELLDDDQVAFLRETLADKHGLTL